MVGALSSTGANAVRASSAPTTTALFRGLSVRTPWRRCRVGGGSPRWWDGLPD